MKKKIVVAAIAALMGVGGYLGYRSMTRSNAGESDLLLANVEALAKDESSSMIPCFWYYTEPENIFLVPTLFIHTCSPCGLPLYVTSARQGDQCPCSYLI